MTTSQTPRWVQRLENYTKALGQLNDAVELSQQRKLSYLEKQGLIQAFEFTHELAWNTLKDYFTYQGNTAITGSSDATREAFKFNLIQDGEGWMEMIQSRNQTSLTYNLQIANEIESKICQQYCLLFNELLKKLSDIYV
ncbi:MAG: nucleotidyltransferase substrate binding protein [Gammaproteobacteria bacterium]